MSDTNTIEVLLYKESLSLKERALKFSQHKARLLPLVKDLEQIGCEFSYPNSLDICLIGDKNKFLTLLRVLRRHGLPTLPIEKGATGFNQFLYLDDFRLYVSFSSTMCRRVKVGTKMEEVDLFETVCDERYPHGEIVADDELPTAPPAEFAA